MGVLDVLGRYAAKLFGVLKGYVYGDDTTLLDRPRDGPAPMTSVITEEVMCDGT